MVYTVYNFLKKKTSFLAQSPFPPMEAEDRKESSNSTTTTIEGKVKRLWTEVRELSFGETQRVDILEGPPSPIEFLREYVMPNKPCIIRGAIDHWPALRAWTKEYLMEAMEDKEVTIHFTPNGRADAVTDHGGDKLFVSAHIERMKFRDAWEHIADSSISKGSVAYAQQQNGCFSSEYSPLFSDVDPHLPWASEALGTLPEAVNMWIGNDMSTTSFHKDHYENLYAVVAGQKHFVLLPPTDYHRMYVKEYPAACYVKDQETGDYSIELDSPLRFVPWPSIEPVLLSEKAMEARISFPRYFEGPKPFECTVQAGEILYLPSMWFHHVTQTPDVEGCTVAINYWYDMQFDIKYAYYNFLQSLNLTERIQLP